MDSWSIGGTREDFNKPPEEFEIPPPNVYKYRLVEKGPDEAQAAQYDPTGTKKRARFVFEVIDNEDWEGTKIGVFYNLTLNEKGFFLPVVEALLGRPLEANEQVGWVDDPDNDIVGIGGRVMMGTLKHDVKEDGRTFGRIESPFPVPKPRARRGQTVVGTKEAELPGDVDAGDDPPF